ncbi:MAG: hypothetical protein ACQEXE_04970 [Bacillota bacterium]
MNLSFWKQVSVNWQSVQQEATEAKIDLEHFNRLILKDIAVIKEAAASYETPIELTNEDDFWGEL